MQSWDWVFLGALWQSDARTAKAREPVLSIWEIATSSSGEAQDPRWVSAGAPSHPGQGEVLGLLLASLEEILTWGFFYK